VLTLVDVFSKEECSICQGFVKEFHAPRVEVHSQT
jgi:hypothetical protein